jgi:hypothetical protein
MQHYTCSHHNRAAGEENGNIIDNDGKDMGGSGRGLLKGIVPAFG